MQTIRISLLGHGLFMDTVRSVLEKHFTIVANDPDLFLVANFGRKVSLSELDMGKYINIHASLLPKLKGASPIQTAILFSENITGYTLIKMDDQIDHGPIIASGKVKILPDDDYDSLANKIALASARKLIHIIPDFLNNKIKLRSQDESKTTWTKKITDQDRIISQDEIKNHPQKADARVRALFPKPKAYIILNGKRLIIHRAKIENTRFIPLLVQLEGKKVIFWQDFLRGWRGKNIFPLAN